MWVKRIGYVVGALLGLVLVAVCSVYAISEVRFRRTYTVAPETIAIADDSMTLARGRHIANAIAGCADCHGEGLGGNAIIDAPPMGRLVALVAACVDGRQPHAAAPGRATSQVRRQAPRGDAGSDPRIWSVLGDAMASRSSRGRSEITES
jgi:mono/diheme cytochrome c family protein